MISNKQSHLDWAHRVSAVLSELGDSGADTASIAVEEAIRAFETDFFSLAILGKAKRGKSTLINALLGRDDDKLAPLDKPSSPKARRAGSMESFAQRTETAGKQCPTAENRGGQPPPPRFRLIAERDNQNPELLNVI